MIGPRAKYVLLTLLLLSGLASAQCDMSCCEAPAEFKVAASCGSGCGDSETAACNCSVDSDLALDREPAVVSQVRLEIQLSILTWISKPVQHEVVGKRVWDPQHRPPRAQRILSPQALPNPPPAAA